MVLFPFCEINVKPSHCEINSLYFLNVKIVFNNTLGWLVVKSTDFRCFFCFNKTPRGLYITLYFIFLKVRLIRSPTFFFVFGIWCSQWCCKLPRMTNKLPCSSFSFNFWLLSLRCFMWNIRSAPKLKEAITGFIPNSFSLSACQPLLSWPSRYKFSKQLVNSKQPEFSLTDFILMRVGENFLGCIVIFEYR